ncbi:MAG: hypothetical protein ABFD82_17660 [Syntrophaceae bacterium]
MATIEDLVNGIQRIQGLDGYAIVKQDGQVLSHNVANVESLSALIVMSGLNGNIIQTDVGASLFKYLVIARKTNERLLVFPIGNLWLGLLQRKDTYTPDIISKVQFLINELKGR